VLRCSRPGAPVALGREFGLGAARGAGVRLWMICSKSSAFPVVGAVNPSRWRCSWSCRISGRPDMRLRVVLEVSTHRLSWAVAELERILDSAFEDDVQIKSVDVEDDTDGSALWRRLTDENGRSG